MAAELFQRVCTVNITHKATAEKTIVEGLRIRFSVAKTAKECTAQLTITNLSEHTAGAIKQGDFVEIVAGYKNNSGLIFSGDAIKVTTTRNETGRETVFQCRAGSANLHNTWLGCSFAKGFSAVEALRDLASRAGCPVEWRNAAELSDKPYAGGFAYSGSLIAGIRQVAARVGGEALIVDGVLFIQPKGGGTPTADAPVLNAASGLLGYPERTVEERDKKQVYGWKLRSLLFPGARVGGFVFLECREVAGAFFPAEEVRHNGDTHGQEWTTEFKVVDQ